MTAEQAGQDLSTLDLQDWFVGNGRDMPWRHTRDPWAILVSEVMLQQTQVGRVGERWPVFLRRFPTPGQCAEARAADVIELWSGMGYNRRAINLHRAAGSIVAHHSGSVPETLDALLELPGVGPYTARAVLVFAFEQPAAVVDTNIGRILARVAGVRLGRSEVQTVADRALGEHDPWTWNQALLDIGASLCCARAVTCAQCPLRDCCAWFQRGNPEPDPALASAAVSVPQSPFEGSDRQGRGRLVDALRRGSISGGEVAAAMGWSDDPERAERVVGGLLADGLVVRDNDSFRLPD